MNEQEIRKAKIFIHVVFILLIIIVLTAFASVLIYKYNHTFTTDKWIENPRQRVNIVNDLLCKYDLTGMTKEEILTLLGEDSGANAYFKEDDNFVYYLGDERGLISIDSEWLILEFSQDDSVIKYEIVTD